MKKHNPYKKIVSWSEEDQCFIGRCPELFFGGVHGDNEAEVYKELCEVVEENIESYEERGIPLPAPVPEKHFSGKFQVRIGSRLHALVAEKASQCGKSLNAFCVDVLEQAAQGRPMVR